MNNERDYRNTGEKAIWDAVQALSPWCESSDMEWCDEILCGLHGVRQRIEHLERERDALAAHDEYKLCLDKVAAALHDWPAGTRNGYAPHSLAEMVTSLRSRLAAAEAGSRLTARGEQVAKVERSKA